MASFEALSFVSAFGLKRNFSFSCSVKKKPAEAGFLELADLKSFGSNHPDTQTLCQELHLLPRKWA